MLVLAIPVLGDRCRASVVDDDLGAEGALSVAGTRRESRDEREKARLCNLLGIRSTSEWYVRRSPPRMPLEQRAPSFPRLLRPTLRQPPVFLGKRARDGAARNELMSWAAPYDDHGALPGTRPAPLAVQQPVTRIFRGLSQQVSRAWGLGQAPSPGGAVVEGGCAQDVVIWTLSNGGILVSRPTVELAKRIGVAAAAATGPADLLAGLLQVARAARAGELAVPTPRLVDPRALSLGHGFLAAIIGHELTHAARQDAVRARPLDPKPAHLRARELVADVGGIELAARAGSSALGAALSPLYFSVAAALAGQTRTPADSSHPTADRYKITYVSLARAARCEGGLLSACQQRELSLLPSRHETKRFLEQVASSVTPR